MDFSALTASKLSRLSDSSMSLEPLRLGGVGVCAGDPGVCPDACCLEVLLRGVEFLSFARMTASCLRRGIPAMARLAEEGPVALRAAPLTLSRAVLAFVDVGDLAGVRFAGDTERWFRSP
mmetsp:Transcript_61996/g.146817  ORF Transcript_61996/g.146817 Transcript_61996/m.146817 type:complete len:120 (-) Transcript_61996:365-724(-)